MLTKKEFDDRLNEVVALMLPFSKDYDTLPQTIKEELSKLINGLYGRTQGIMLELNAAVVAIGKKRDVFLQTFVDVSEGHADLLFAKSTEFKSVATALTGAVDTQINKALDQIAGKKNPGGRVDDHRIIDLSIDDKRNCWPFTDNYYVTNLSKGVFPTEKEFFDQVVSRLDKNLPQALEHWLKDGSSAIGASPLALRDAGVFVNKVPNLPNAHPSSSRQVSLSQYGSKLTKIATLTIKIRYKDAYFRLRDSAVEQIFVDEVVFQTFYVNKMRSSKISKVKFQKVSLSGLGKINQKTFF